MPARPRIAAVIAALALAAPAAAGAQSGAGDAQYQDPFAVPPARETGSPSALPARDAAAQGRPQLGVAEPAIRRPAPAKDGGGVDLLPVAAAGVVVLLLGGLALRRRPHAAR